MGACCCGPSKSEEDATTIVADSTTEENKTESVKTDEKPSDSKPTDTKSKNKSSDKSSSSSSSSSRSKSKVDPNAENELTIRIIQGRNLPSQGSDKSNAYVVIHADNKKYQTSACQDSVFPIWDDNVVITDKGLFARLKELKFDLFAKNSSASDQLLGSFRIKFGCELKSCVTPAVWYTLRDATSNKPISSAEVQVQLQFRSDTRIFYSQSYTHVLELTILSGRNLRDMDWLQSQGRPQRQPYVSVEVGRQSFRASTQTSPNLKDISAPVWNETLYLLLDDTRNRDWQMVISLLDKDLRVDDRVGTAYLPLRAIYDARDIYNRPFEGEVILQPRMVNIDRGLRSIRYRGRDKKGNDVGRLLLRGKLIKREDVEVKLCNRLLEGLDKKGDGKLQKSDVRQVLTYLELNMDAKGKKDKEKKKMEKFMKKSDSGVVAREEIMLWMKEGTIADTESAAKLVQYHLKHKEDGDILAEKLMDGVLGRTGVWGE